MFKQIVLVLALVMAFPARLPADAAASARHGFDWNFGTWKTHIRRLQHPLSGSSQWVAYDGVVTVRPLLGGAANVEEVEADGSSHIEFLAVRTFDPRSQQWIVNQADGSTGELGQPAFGKFENGRGVFYDVETFQNRT